MTGRDRTNEFVETIKSRREKPQWIQQRRTINGGLDAAQNQANKLAIDQQYREFMQVSKECSHRIANSCEKLQHLTQLAKQRTVFDDSQVNRLIAEIRAEISESRNQLDYIQSHYKPKQKHSENIVTTLQRRLVNITSDFKSALEVRSRSVQEQSKRLERYTGISPVEPGPHKATTSQSLQHLRPTTSSPSLVRNYQDQATNETYSLDMGSSDGQLQAYDRPQFQQQQQMLLQDDQIDLSERADKMHLIESTIVELGTVFNQLAQMVQTQGETITRIDMNISETTDNVEAAHDALLRYFASINSNRWLMLKVFGILFFFFILFVVFAV